MFTATVIQRFEGVVIGAVAIYMYWQIGYSWLWFLILLLVPDISMAGYLVNNRVGALVYNFGHSLAVPALLTVLSYSVDNPLTLAIGIIWLAHVGMDRALGFGLKFDSGFKDTHLGRIRK